MLSRKEDMVTIVIIIYYTTNLCSLQEKWEYNICKFFSKIYLLKEKINHATMKLLLDRKSMKLLSLTIKSKIVFVLKEK